MWRKSRATGGAKGGEKSGQKSGEKSGVKGGAKSWERERSGDCKEKSTAKSQGAKFLPELRDSVIHHLQKQERLQLAR